ncbi:hypothetical protein D3C85_1350710 [compost metagenome]
MTQPDRKHQKWHEDRIRIKVKPQGGQQSKQPDNSNDRAQQHQQRATHTTGVPEQHDSANHQRRSEEQLHLSHTVDQVTHHLGETGDVDLDVVGFVPGPNLFELA